MDVVLSPIIVFIVVVLCGLSRAESVQKCILKVPKNTKRTTLNYVTTQFLTRYGVLYLKAFF